MIRLREFNMAELEYFIDPEILPEHDFSEWSKIEFDLISEDQGQIKSTISKAVETGMVRHPTVGYFIGKTYDFLTKVGIDNSKIRFRQHETTEMAHYATDCWDAEIFWFIRMGGMCWYCSSRLL